MAKRKGKSDETQIQPPSVLDFKVHLEFKNKKSIIN